ncbi:MAG: hypothetical protein IT453_10985 [Planctomycetes bacterium]|nr:hypothetical protein [Planctomycetota bacterium]
MLDDLYIRFFRLAEKRIGDAAEFGIVSYISNSSYLTGRSHPLMRESLLDSFQAIWIDNLHGNRIASERTPTGESCETIFHVSGGGAGIKVGTCISTLLKQRTPKRKGSRARVMVRDFWGSADSKRSALLEAIGEGPGGTPPAHSDDIVAAEPRPYSEVTVTKANRWRFVSQESTGGFEDWPAIDELFPVGIQGVNPNRGLNCSVLDLDRAALVSRMTDYFSASSHASFGKGHPTLWKERARYKPEVVRDWLRANAQFDAQNIRPYLLFPFDQRWIYYEDRAKLLNEARSEFGVNLPGNEFLVLVPQPRRPSESRPMYCRTLADLHLHDRGSVCFPVTFLTAADRQSDRAKGQSVIGSRPMANISAQVWRKLSDAWGLSGELGDPSAATLVRTLFHMALAVLHSPSYERDHRESLAHDWAHLPIPREQKVAEQIASIGMTVAELLDASRDARTSTQYIVGEQMRELAVAAKSPVGAVAESDLRVTCSYFGGAKGRWEPRDVRDLEQLPSEWGRDTGDLWLNDAVFLRHVPRAVWEYELGGYPVVKKWLGYRQEKRIGGRGLTMRELDDLRGIVQRIAAVLLLRPKLDGAYEAACANAFSAEELGLRS